MSNTHVTAEEAFLAAQIILNKTATLVKACRQLRPMYQIKLRDELYNLIDQYWKYQEIAMNAQAKSKL